VTFHSIRSEFPITNEWIYLDNAGAVPLPRFVSESMKQFMDEYYHESITDHWSLLQDTVKECRILFAKLIGSRPEEVALIGSTSEGMNIVANLVDFCPGDNVVVTDLEFPANLFPWLNLTRKGVEVRTAKVSDAELPLEAIARCVDDRTRVVAVAHVAFSTGLRLDLAPIADLAHAYGAFLAVDAVQSIGVVPLDVHAAEVDFLACSGFKWLMSPSGTGAFFCREELIHKYHPAYVSWFSVQNPYNFVPGGDFHLAEDASRFMISGNINLIGFQGFREALKFVLNTSVDAIFSHVQSLLVYIMERAEALELSLITPSELSRLGSIINIRVPDPDRLVQLLRNEHIYAVQRVGGVRFSPYIYNTRRELEIVMGLVEDFVKLGKKA
jgi:selenocysteine lyase/cysteine desulfurase